MSAGAAHASRRGFRGPDGPSPRPAVRPYVSQCNSEEPHWRGGKASLTIMRLIIIICIIMVLPTGFIYRVEAHCK
jgi:hypothetical protein